MTKKNSSSKPLRVGLISLGCAKNLVDAEIMLGSLMKSGVAITNDAAQADAVIVNTCSFIDSAQEESVDTIFESVELRDANRRGQAVIVSGCLSQRFREELPKLMPEVDAFMGIDQVAQVGDIVGKAVASRAGKVADKKLKIKNSKTKIAARLNELEKNRPHDEQEQESAVRGTEKFGKTKTVVAPQSAIRNPQSPILDVTPRPVFIPDFETPRFRLTPKHFAYLKIAEGCNHPCSFCIIPRMRGSHRSRTQSDIVAEAKALIADGVKEINLISQDSTYYGLDLRPNHSRAISSPEKFSAATKSLSADATTICTLLRELNSLKGDFWIRLLYTHPAHWTDELIRTMAECKKVARYVDIPLQHIHENMLERMRRETSQQYIVDLIEKIRAGIPGIALRTTFIVGFPGETDASFNTLLDFIRETKFERLGVFTYSKEDGTRAGSMSGQISDKIKQKRRELAMAAQHKIAVAVSESFVGREIKVLVEGEANSQQLQSANVSSWEHGLIREKEISNLKLKTGNYLVARGEADAPDIDGRVYIRAGRSSLPVGGFATVKVIGHTDYDLIAGPVSCLNGNKIRWCSEPLNTLHAKAVKAVDTFRHFKFKILIMKKLLPQQILCATAVAFALAVGVWPQNINAQTPPAPAAADTSTVPATPVVPPPNIVPGSPYAEVVRLTQAGVDESIISTYVANSTSLFNLDSDKIIYLTNLGAPSSLVTAMMQRDQQLQQQFAATQAAQQAQQAPPAPAAPAPEAVPTNTAELVPPPEPTPVSVDYFYYTLAPYGSWVFVGGYGRCWRPTVCVYNSGWQPYCDNGHWVYTDCGWYWASGYAWGATFHYGRWFRNPGYGWCWCPDTVWAPSWVTWRYSNNYCGWAPLPPHTTYQAGVGILYNGGTVGVGFNFGLGANCFTFVPTACFCNLHPRNYCVVPAQVTQVYNSTVVINNYNINNRVIVNHGIAVGNIAAASRTTIRPVPVHQINKLTVQNAQSLPANRPGYVSGANHQGYPRDFGSPLRSPNLVQSYYSPQSQPQRNNAVEMVPQYSAPPAGYHPQPLPPRTETVPVNGSSPETTAAHWQPTGTPRSLTGQNSYSHPATQPSAPAYTSHSAPSQQGGYQQQGSGHYGNNGTQSGPGH